MDDVFVVKEFESSDDIIYLTAEARVCYKSHRKHTGIAIELTRRSIGASGLSLM